jgi:site-specific DNA-methyltransferase (adenine-specific)
MLPDPVLRTKLGALYEGDCVSLLKQVADESVDLGFADPPFNLGKQYSSKMNDSIKDSEYLAWCREWVTEMIRVLAPGGSLLLYNLPKWNLALGSMLMERLTFRHWITVDMKFSLPISGRLYPANYSLLYFVKGKRPKVFHPDRLPLRTCRHCGGELQDYGGYKNKMNPKGVSLSDVWTDIPPVRHSKYKDREANQLSLKLMDRVIAMASDEGSVVLDPFGGSGTTFVAAELLSRKWIGFELHCAEIVSRFEDLSSERKHLVQIHGNKNVLFTRDALEKRAKNGKRVDKYNAAHSLEHARLTLPSEEPLPLFG